MLKYLLLFIASTLMAQQRPADAVYLEFNEDQIEDCKSCDANGRDYTFQYSQKRQRKVGLTRLIRCREIFVYSFQTDYFEVISAAQAENLKRLSLQEAIDKACETDNADLNTVYPNLFALEKLESGEYACFRIRWEQRL